MRSVLRYLHRENAETARQIEKIPPGQKWAGDLVAAGIVGGILYALVALV